MSATSPGSEIPRVLIRAARRFKLTQRELDVLDMLIVGESWKTTAVRLEISVSMVRVHSKNLLRKINAQTVANAVAKIFCPDTYVKA